MDIFYIFYINKQNIELKINNNVFYIKISWFNNFVSIISPDWIIKMRSNFIGASLFNIFYLKMKFKKLA